MTELFAKYGLHNKIALGIVLFFLSTLLHQRIMNPNAEKDLNRLERVFQEKVDGLESSLEQFSRYLQAVDYPKQIWEHTNKFHHSGYEFSVFLKDSLIYWTSNTVSLKSSLFSETEKGVVLLENGWYYLTTRRLDDYLIVGKLLIKSEFPYENENLINEFSPEFDFNYQAKLSKVSDDFVIRFADGTLAFSVSDLHPLPPNVFLEIILLFSFLIAIMLIVLGLWQSLDKLFEKKKTAKFIIGLAGLFLLRIGIYIVDWKRFFEGFYLLNPNVFASSHFSPTPADLIINVLTAVVFAEYILSASRSFFEKLNNNTLLVKITSFSALSLFFVLSHFISNIVSDIILNSDVPLEFYNFMSLKPASFLFLLIFFSVLWVYYRLSVALLLGIQSLQISTNDKGLIWFLLAACYLILELFVFDKFPLFCLMPLILSLLLLFLDSLKKQRYRFAEVIGLLVLFSAHLSLLLNHTQNQKELENREMYAKELISEKELETELEYAQTAVLLQNSVSLQNFLKEPDLVRENELKRHLLRKYFQGYWNRYDIDLYIYDADTLPISTYVQIHDDPAKKIDKIIAAVGEQSEASEYIYYVSDFTDNLSYVVRQPIVDTTIGILGFLYLGLRSKIIPQEMGFPRLLLNENSKVFFKLENYDMAKYVRGKLVMRFGSYNYPLSIGSFLVDLPRKSGIVSDGDYIHLIKHGESNKTIVLTKRRVGFEDYLTTFSFLFSTFGLILILYQVISGRIAQRWSTMKLAFRIQLLFISLVFFSLLFSGIGTGTYVKQQYTEYQEGQLREKISSVQKELQSKLENENYLNEPVLADYLEYLLNKFASVFITDMNLYGIHGKLLATSRPEIFNLGLLNQQMNAEAYRQMSNRKLSLYVNQEAIGNQKYWSAYVPLMNFRNEVIAYLNLPYFARQNDFENEIAGFLSAIINIFVLLLALSIVIALFVTSKIVDPLKKIQESLSEFRLGKTQQPIAYRSNDEIGILVREYNTKLKELQESSEKLAKTEREMAWREMAKQVAHEIKNPLTPMKLRIQHFLRTFDPESADAKRRLEKFSASLIEQIDTLTNIANAFSNFAKMPKTQFESVDLVRIMQSAVETFSSEENIQINSNYSSPSILIEGDKELLLRVFNNLIKNAIQAIPPNEAGKIEARIIENNQYVSISIEDNGSGISNEMRDKIFVPNFTTKSTGTGLGLAMVKQIIESHNGQVSFESKPGQTIFIIQLPKRQNQ
jgi:signal transduction histidine kinase